MKEKIILDNPEFDYLYKQINQFTDEKIIEKIKYFKEDIFDNTKELEISHQILLTIATKRALPIHQKIVAHPLKSSEKNLNTIKLQEYPTLEEFKLKAKENKNKGKYNSLGQSLNSLAKEYGYKEYRAIKPILEKNKQIHIGRTDKLLTTGGEGENKRKSFSKARKGNKILKGTQEISDYFENKNIIEFDIGEHEYNSNTKTLTLKYFDKDIIEKTFKLPILISIENFKEEDAEEYLSLFARLHKEYNPNSNSKFKYFQESINLFKNNVNSPFKRIKKPVKKNPKFRELEHKTNKKY